MSRGGDNSVSEKNQLSPVTGGELVDEQNVVPLDHVEAVLNRVIPDLEQALHSIQDLSLIHI